MTLVTKRDNCLEDLDINKIKKVIKWASENTDINPLKLESSCIPFFKEQVSTRDIQQQLINKAVSFVSLEEPDWNLVAGRLVMMNVWKEVELSRTFGYGNYYQSVAYLTSKHYYSDALLTTYTKENLELAGSWIVPERDLTYVYSGSNLLQKVYLVKDELLQEAYLTIALLIASEETNEKQLDIARRIYEVISTNKISLATPLLRNLRRPDGNLSSCFTLEIADSLLNEPGSLTEVWKDAASISKQGGGLGVLLSRLRASGSWVNGAANASSGVIPWVKILNDIAVAVNQCGVRPGAITTALDIWHLDIEDFLELQTEAGDSRRKAMDIFPQVVIPDLFMNRVEKEGNWTLFDPYEVLTKYDISLVDVWGSEFEVQYQFLEQEAKLGNLKLHKTVPAKYLFKKIITSFVETGLPYLTFKDNINLVNPNKNSGVIKLVNLCVESYSVTEAGKYAHCCNLCSINGATLEDDELEELCSIAVRILDNAINLTNTPTEIAKSHNETFRTIGVGFMALHDYLARRNIQYQNSHEVVDELFEKFAYYCTKASHELGKEKGSFKAFDSSEWASGKCIGKPIDWFLTHSNARSREWLELSTNISNTKAMRNSQVTAIAPNTRSALIQGCTNSIIPVFNKLFFDTNGDGSTPIIAPFIKDKFWYYTENRNINQLVVAEIGTIIQKWIDTGISLEFLFDLNKDHVDATHVKDVIFSTWKNGGKATYYIRWVKENSDNKDTTCYSCAN